MGSDNDEILAQLLLVVKEQADAQDQLAQLAKQKIRLMRKANHKGLSMRQIADHCGISSQRVQQQLSTTPKKEKK